MSLLAYHHKELVTFLKEVRDTTSEFSFISSQTEESKLFNLIVDSKDVRIKQAKAAEAIGKNASHLRKKIQPNLNNMLKAFSLRCGIKPSIQLFFSARGSYSGGHFACCDVPENQSKSDHFIRLKDLKDMIERARQRLGMKCESFGHTKVSHTSPFMKLEKRLEPFHKRYPTKEDFEEGGSYCRIDELHEEVANKLREKKRCLIIGNPGCGKTTLALALGYDFLQDNYSVYYHDASTPSDIEHLTDFMESFGKNHLVILDNAHAEFKSINKLLCTVHEHNTLLLVTSRNVDSTVTQSQHPDDLREGISYVGIFKEEDAFIELSANQKTIRHIIDQYIGSIVPEEKIGNIDTLVDKCKADYNILRFYIQAWKSKGRTGCLSDVYEKEILGDVFTRYLKDKPYQLELLKIAALSQFEIDVDSKWINVNLDELQKDGLVQLTGTDEIVPGAYFSWIRIYHPSAAEYFVKAAAFKHCRNIKSTNEFTLQCVKGYLIKRPFLFFLVFRQIFGPGQKWLYNEILNDPIMFQVAAETIQQYYFAIYYFRFFQIPIMIYLEKLTIIDTYGREEVVENFLNPLLKRVEEESFRGFHLLFVNMIFQSMKRLNINTCERPLNIDFEALGRQARDDEEHIGVIAGFINHAMEAEVPKKKICSFCNEMDFKMLGMQESRRKDDLMFMAVFVSLVSEVGISKEKIQCFCDELDYSIVGAQAKKNGASYYDVSAFMNYSLAAGISKEKIQSFCNQLDYKALGRQERLYRESLERIVFLPQMMKEVGVTEEQIVSFIKELNFELLGENASNNEASVHSISDFIHLLFWAKIESHRIDRFCSGLVSNLYGYSILIVMIQASKNIVAKYIESFLKRRTSNDIENMLKDAKHHILFAFLFGFQMKNNIIKLVLSEKTNIAILDDIVCKYIDGVELKCIGEMLFAFHYINRCDLSHRFIGVLEKNINKIIAGMGRSDLCEIDSFLWHTWLASEGSVVPKFFYDRRIVSVIEKRLGDDIDSDLKSSLGIMGTYNLACDKTLSYSMPDNLMEAAKKLCGESMKHQSVIDGFNVFANNLPFSSNERNDILEYLNGINHTLVTANQQIAIERLMQRLQ